MTDEKEDLIKEVVDLTLECEQAREYYTRLNARIQLLLLKLDGRKVN